MKEKQITKVFKISKKTMNEMIEYFEPLKREKTPPYAILQAVDGDSIVTIYESGKIVFQGKDADIASEYWIATEKINSGKDPEQKKEKEITTILPSGINTIGSDEVGTGDYFGPIIVTAAYVSKENENFLKELNVKDSKKLTDNDILNIVPQIVKKIPYHSFILNNKNYNQFHNDNMNMNKIKAILHNKVICEFLKENKYNYDYIVIDQFEPPRSFYNHIKDSIFKPQNITFMTKAEDKCLSVACASMISRYIFLKEIDKLSAHLGETVPKGAGTNVDEFGKKIVAKYGKDKLKEISKLNFKNTSKILGTSDKETLSLF